MPERAASVPYQGFQEESSRLATPQLSAGDKYLDVHANPNQFGAQVGGALEKFGQTAENLGNKTSELALYQAGLANEAATTKADADLSMKVGKIYGDYATLTGSAAVAAAPKAKQAIIDAQQSVIQGMSPAAARATDMITRRTMSQRVIDIDVYAAQQQKQALRDSGLNLVDASLPVDAPTATDDGRFGERIGNIKHGIGMQMHEELAPHIETNPDTGEIKINDATPEGSQAKVAYQQNVDNSVGQLWSNRFNTLANTPGIGPIAAQKKFEEEKDKIPSFAAAHIQSILAPQVWNAHVEQAVSNGMVDAQRGYAEHLTNPPPVGQIDAPTKHMDIAGAIHKFGEGGKVNERTSVDGAMGGWQIMPATFARYARPGENINNAADNEAVGRRIVDDLKSKFPDDPARVAVGYFSGEGNVAPKGSPAPWKEDREDGNGTKVSQYVDKLMKGVGLQYGQQSSQDGAPSQKAIPVSYATNEDGSMMSQADYMQVHRPEILAKWAGWAERQMPGDLQFRNEVLTRARQQIEDQVSSQSARYRQDNTNIIRAVNGDLTNGKPPMSYSELAAIPNIKPVLNRVEAQDPRFAQGIEGMISRVNKGADKDANTYGEGFKNTQEEIWNGKVTDEKPLQMAVANGDLTQSGYDRAVKLLDHTKTPEGKSELEMQKASFKAAEAMVTHGMPNSPQGAQRWAAAVPALYQAIQERQSRKISPGQYYDPENKEWIGNDVKAIQMSKTQALQASVQANKDAVKVRSATDIANEAWVFRNDPKKLEQLKQEATNAGYFKPNQPVEPTPPISQ